MCGILGQIKLQKDILKDSAKFSNSLNLLAHRGPDDSALTVDDKFIFGHRRLRIIDLSKLASQPMVTEDKKVIISFNGEIYNYKELRDGLVKAGYVFKSDCDTEVLLNGFHCYGLDFIQKCNGMFAFGIYDKRYDKAYLLRDRLGIKPLYYCLENGRLTFSSEVKAILAFEDIKRRLNMDAISSYLSFRYPVLDDTFFENILSLPPGHYLEVNNGKVRVGRYWDPLHKINEQKNDRGEDYYVSELKDIFQSSVKYRMMSDVPVGAFLSGGIDSSVIATEMAKASSKPIETFTIGYKENEYNEFKYANMMVAKCHSVHHQITTNESLYFENLLPLINYKDAPLSIPNEVTHFELCRELKKYATVVLTGGGSDEIFYGYGRIFRSTYDYERLAKLASMDFETKESFLKNCSKKYGTTNFQDEIDHLMNIYSYTSLDTKRKLLDSSINLEGIEEKFRTKFQGYFNEASFGTHLDRMGYFFRIAHLPGILLHNDTISMATSVELRVPFLDYRLVEFALTVPVQYKMKWISNDSQRNSLHLMSDSISEVYDTPKYILKKAYENEVPHEILYRRKVGFPVPLHLWVGGSSKNYIKDLLLSDRARKRGIYNVDYLEKLFSGEELQYHKGDSRTYQYSLAGRVWMLMNLELFLRKYFD